MAVRWFRISFARNAFVRALAGADRPLENLTLLQGVVAMEEFYSGHRPQHAELDELECQWGPVGDDWEFAIVRRMQRHEHPEAQLRLVFTYTRTVVRSSEGTARVRTRRDVSELPGYLSTRGSRPRARRLDQV